MTTSKNKCPDAGKKVSKKMDTEKKKIRESKKANEISDINERQAPMQGRK